jgi:putative molybdopterin biosynthesis protein
MKRNVYLRMKTLDEARRLFFGAFDWQDRLESETLPVSDAVGRVLAAPVNARLSAPSYHGAAMDGIAVRATATYGASDQEPRVLQLGSQAHYVNTGEMLPPGTDAVIMIEQVQVLGPDRVSIENPTFPWKHVRRVGEDIVATEMLFVRNHRLTPTDVGALMAGGQFSVQVLRRPRVLILPTGGEMVSPEDLPSEGPKPGTIVEFNGTMLGKLVEAHGGSYRLRRGTVDDPQLIRQAILEAVSEGDMVLVIGGSSAGAKDFTRTAIADIGEVLVHGVTVMPGKPTLLAKVANTPVVGIPGYPVSAIISFDQFVAPALTRMQQQPEPTRPKVMARPARKIASRLGMEEFIRVRLGRVGETLVAAPLPRGAGTVTSFVQADGLLRIPANLEGVHSDGQVEVELLRSAQEIEGNLIAVGSHDLCLDVLADLLRGHGASTNLVSSHVGSLGGLLALREGTCHLAGCHLLEPTDGTYNTAAVERVLPGVPVRLVHLVDREQGLLVPPGNPKGVSGLQDLTRPELGFINRQRGSGTRVLLDHELAQRGIQPSAVKGYGDHEYTHMAVAVAVLSGAADVGLGIRSAARALGLDFIPVARERYELVIAEAFMAHPGIVLLLQILQSQAFADRVVALGGYDVHRTGEQRRLG